MPMAAEDISKVYGNVVEGRKPENRVRCGILDFFRSRNGVCIFVDSEAKSEGPNE